ncbi:uncharacterized protein LOC143076289 [Mytilus galloprovincialis]|uniref:uncharacterized protein LOC143076289 n=1 Tax=Mytilus galloprovincialis TaxID=29158 RepID=UPI003F7B469F
MERSAMHSVCGESLSVVEKSGHSDTEYVVYVLEDNKLKRVSNIEDVASTSTCTSTSVTSNTCTTVTWDDKSIKLLLEQFRQMEESKKPVKNKWQLMSDKMKRFNYDFSSEQCRLKVKSLKEKQLRNQKLSNKSGEGNPIEDTIDEKLDEVFLNQPDVNPVHVLQS